jgi:hypothetical protein
MKDCDSRSWIDGEGLSSRDQVNDKREHKKHRWIFSKRNPKSVSHCMEFSI